jgi:hypothetical protein
LCNTSLKKDLQAETERIEKGDQGRELKRLPPLMVSLTFLFTARMVFLALAFKEIGAVC